MLSFFCCSCRVYAGMLASQGSLATALHYLEISGTTVSYEKPFLTPSPPSFCSVPSLHFSHFASSFPSLLLPPLSPPLTPSPPSLLPPLLPSLSSHRAIMLYYMTDSTRLREESSLVSIQNSHSKPLMFNPSSSTWYRNVTNNNQNNLNQLLVSMQYGIQTQPQSPIHTTNLKQVGYETLTFIN